LSPNSCKQLQTFCKLFELQTPANWKKTTSQAFSGLRRGGVQTLPPEYTGDGRVDCAIQPSQTSGHDRRAATMPAASAPPVQAARPPTAVGGGYGGERTTI
jgi:hypothetical protein